MARHSGRGRRCRPRRRRIRGGQRRDEFLAATGGRWVGLAGARFALGRIGRITLAFTAGHSVALAATALGHLDIPGRPVEAFIALSILIGAVHAIHPLFPGREALVAGLFGLGHGMAFSFVLAEMHLSTGQLVTNLLGFNLGIELVQLLLVCLALPSLLVLARLRIQPLLRLAGATLTGAAALGWLADRLQAWLAHPADCGAAARPAPISERSPRPADSHGTGAGVPPDGLGERRRACAVSARPLNVSSARR
ncbi:HupE/UreJ family protein [Streptomyces sp. WM6386]|uniref:HupE/UreJ family protein n=1 Tax=Streptomyces sp. WM6386 TaxID=1415558 RepID=UPI000698A8DD|nr:HupE/UreJ family protein [Streptomyces sp. WM6386]